MPALHPERSGGTVSPKKTPARFTPEEDAELIRLHNAGCSCLSIASKLGRSDGAIHGRARILAKRGELERASVQASPYAPTRKPAAAPRIGPAVDLVYVHSWSYACRVEWEHRTGLDLGPKGEE